MSQHIKRAVLYARVSLVDLNPQNQLVPLKQYCKANGLLIVREFTDRASGRTDDRPALRKAVASVTSEEADILVAYSLDRLSRSISHLIGLVATLRERHKGIYVLRESLDLSGSNPQSDLFLHIFAALSQFEAAIISDRTKNALAVAKLKGVKLGRPRKISEPLESEILQMRAAGLAVREIARRLPNLSRASIQAVLKRNKPKT